MRRSLRQVVAACSLLSYVLLLGGVPLPAPVAKDPSRPFPCQGHRCGCATADQCWQRCCCYTHAQKLAWARRHGVQPPAEMLAVASGGCCATENAKCCAEQQPPRQVADESPVDSVPSGIDGLRALRCHGHDAPWATATCAVPLATAVEFLLLAEFSGWCRVADATTRRVVLALDPPPPKA